MHPNVHRSIVYNGQDVEATSVSITNELRRRGIYYNGTVLSHKKKNEILPFATTWVAKGQREDGIKEDIMLSEILIRERQILYDITYMQNLKNKTN